MDNVANPPCSTKLKQYPFTRGRALLARSIALTTTFDKATFAPGTSPDTATGIHSDTVATSVDSDALAEIHSDTVATSVDSDAPTEFHSDTVAASCDSDATTGIRSDTVVTSVDSDALAEIHSDTVIASVDSDATTGIRSDTVTSSVDSAAPAGIHYDTVTASVDSDVPAEIHSDTVTASIDSDVRVEIHSDTVTASVESDVPAEIHSDTVTASIDSDVRVEIHSYTVTASVDSDVPAEIHSDTVTASIDSDVRVEIHSDTVTASVESDAPTGIHSDTITDSIDSHSAGSCSDLDSDYEFVADSISSFDGSDADDHSADFPMLHNKCNKNMVRKCYSNITQPSLKGNKVKPKRPCLYCGTYNLHIVRHLKRKHDTEEKVSAALALPKKEQDRAFATIRKLGIKKQNMKFLQQNKSLIRERKQGKGETMMCSSCNGFYDSRTMYRHKKVCPGEGTSSTISFSSLSKTASELSIGTDFKENVLDKFRKDEAGSLCKSDLLILLLGKRMWAKSIKRERSIVMVEMRLLANLVLALRKSKGDSNLKAVDVLNRCNFEFLTEAIETLTAKENGESKSGLKVRIGFLLKRAIKVMKGYYIMTESYDKETEVNYFEKLLDLNWTFIFFTAQVTCEQRRSGLRKPSAMPVSEDIAKFRNYLVAEMKTMLDDQYLLWENHSFIKLRNITLARLLLFNARRGGEPARLTLQEWKDACDNVWVDSHQVEKVNDPIEKKLLDNYKLAYLAGKGSRKLVPIIIPKDTIEPMNKLVSISSDCGVALGNPFVFPSTGQSADHVSGYHSLKAAVNLLNTLKRPDLLIADKFRHRISTEFARLELPQEERQPFYRHMGHSEAINTNVYQSPLAITEVTKVGKFLQAMDSQDESDQDGDISLESPGQSNQNRSSLVDCQGQTDQSRSADMDCDENQSFTSLDSQEKQDESKASLRRPYTHWSRRDAHLIKAHFASYIEDISVSDPTKGSLPPKKDILEFLTKNNVLQGAASLKKPALIKTKIFNERKKFRSSIVKKM